MFMELRSNIFVGRDAILNELATRLGESPQSTLVIGQRRIGKTALLLQIINEFSKTFPNHIFIYLDAKKFNVIDGNFSDMFWQETFELTQEKIRTNIQSPSSPNNYYQLFVELVSSQRKRVVLLIDNIDIYFQTVGDNNDLRKIRQITDSELKNHIILIATCTRDPNRVIERNSRLVLNESPFYNFAVNYLLPFPPDEVTSYLDFLETKLSKEEIRFVYETSGGHPGLLCLTLEYLIPMKTKFGRPLSQPELVATQRNLLIDERIIWLCKVLYSELPPSQQEILRKIMEREENLALEQTIPALLKLINHFGMVRREGGHLAIFSTAFSLVMENELFGTSHSSQAFKIERPERSEETALSPNFLIDFEKDKRVLMKDGTSIPLTNLESRLLAYLLEKRNKVCTHEELLTNVWPNNRSIAVVERGINRLREKIEDDAATPRRLLTEKGKGYILVAS